ncbi:hypothetical protein CLOP_g7822 [Closterium sp. NIES-67]|nr:hypothetical protein CLOP_g7822 [Closterium sp. NIES-67]
MSSLGIGAKPSRTTRRHLTDLQPIRLERVGGPLHHPALRKIANPIPQLWYALSNSNRTDDGFDLMSCEGREVEGQPGSRAGRKAAPPLQETKMGHA